MTVGDVYRALWRHKLFIALLTIAMVGAAWVATSRQQRVYTASSLIRIQQDVKNPNDLYGALTTGGRLAQTYQQIVETSTIAHGISRILGGRVPYSAIAGNVTAAQVQDLDLLTIEATSPDPRVAMQIANTAPRALRQFIRRTATLGDQIITVQPSAVPGVPSSPKVKLNLAIAFLIGLIVNGTLALLIEIVGDSVAELDEFETIAGAPVLGLVPNLDLVEPRHETAKRQEAPSLDAVGLGEAASGG